MGKVHQAEQGSAEEVMLTLVALGEDPSASRVEGVRAFIDWGAVADHYDEEIEGFGRDQAVRAAVVHARQQIDSGNMTWPVKGRVVLFDDSGEACWVLRSGARRDVSGHIVLGDIEHSTGDFDLKRWIAMGSISGPMRDMVVPETVTGNYNAVFAWASRQSVTALSAGAGLASGGSPVGSAEDHARYIVGGWSHIFSAREGDRSCRLVFDIVEHKVSALQLQHSVRGWVEATASEVADVQDSILTANGEALDEPEQCGLERTSELPQWAQASLTKARLMEAASLRTRARELLDQAHALDGLKPFMVIHEHEYGTTGYLAWSEQKLSQAEAEGVLDAKFEEDREEVLTVTDPVSLEELTGSTVVAQRAEQSADAAMVPDFAARFDDADRYRVPVESKLMLFLPVTDFRPEAMRVSKRVTSDATWYEVEIYHPERNSWIEQKTHSDLQVAVDDATNWYPDPARAKTKAQEDGPLPGM
ncbi:hypothetical protein [Ralstonia sp. ASV6]|uniref:hypothetical protein n=1 Tax=Ralstonia sp. ASV6 TaxID=2795124 RepID=UPI0018ECAE08|nr:hypothetical protein [Ralstonia sp. ASV6]